jgi:superfamily II DNA or RNA helicase
MKLDNVIARINNERVTLIALGCTPALIDWYVDQVEDGFKPSAYTALSTELLAKDIILAYQYSQD